MKKKFAVLLVLGLAASTLNVSAKQEARMANPDQQKVMKQVEKIDKRVAAVETAIPQLTRKEVMLKSGSLKSVTDEQWSKLHTYSSKSGEIERLRVYPMKGSKKTEEFYYNRGNLVFAFLEKDGAGKEGHDANAKGAKYYFDRSGVFAVIGEGGQMEAMDSSTKAMGAKLQRESRAFRDSAK